MRVPRCICGSEIWTLTEVSENSHTKNTGEQNPRILTAYRLRRRRSLARQKMRWKVSKGRSIA